MSWFYDQLDATDFMRGSYMSYKQVDQTLLPFDTAIRALSPRVLVIGDVCRDIYSVLTINGVDRKLLIPKYTQQKQWSRLGGAATVAEMLTAAGCDVTLRLPNVLGHNTTELRNDMEDASYHYDLQFLTEGPCQQKIPRKHRLLVSSKSPWRSPYADDYQPLLRFDDSLGEASRYCNKPRSLTWPNIHCYGWCESLQYDNYDAVVIVDQGDDYGWAYLQCVIDAAPRADIYVVTNSTQSLDVLANTHGKQHNVRRVYVNAKTFDDARWSFSRPPVAPVVVTNSHEPVRYFSDDWHALEHADVRLERARLDDMQRTTDATGAGDTFAAYAIAAELAKQPLRDSLRVGMLAGFLQAVKPHFGIATDILCRENLRLAYLRRVASSPVVLDEDELVRFCHNQHVTAAPGCFDVLHAGHLEFLDDFGGVGTDMVRLVSLNSDESVRRLKGENRPIHTQFERARALMLLGLDIDVIHLFNTDTPAPHLLKLPGLVSLRKGQPIKREDVPELQDLPNVDLRLPDSFGLHSELSTTKIEQAGYGRD